MRYAWKQIHEVCKQALSLSAPTLDLSLGDMTAF